MGREVCLRMGCSTGCNCVAHTSRLTCFVLVRIMDTYAKIPWTNRPFGTLEFSTLLYSLAILLGVYDQQSASRGKRDV